MVLTDQEKESLKNELVRCLCGEKEIRRIVVFGSFLNAEDPQDLDVAVFQDSGDSYLPLALKYREKTRPIAKRIPVDILPLKVNSGQDPFLEVIGAGETIYES